ncbi:toll/interleukin-1 receptor domain-containing protein [Parasphingopyxis algicola]|uniref:toll/interleukin-1 receptor domain-containing protein n=1 Tax=Parasphingopyxis algicola TaxID=2026624 RepID=UPI0015A3BA2D|nr:toll/interleukin-1 receptor domain-containing protein [Parasphingopyxis algicola]QLC26281.1 toll/interleukin-1 receptor domain-containing protein [Parasphingopyxis algicola]
MTDVFISYARKNRERVRTIAEGLTDHGYSLWWDTALKASDNYAIKIEKALDATRSVVVCWSQQAKESLWVRAEATEALDNDKLIQLKLDESRMPLPFNVLNMIAFDGWNGERTAPEWTELERAVGEKAGRHSGGTGGETELTREAPPELKQRLQGLGPVATIGFGLVVLTVLISTMTVMLGEDLVELGLYRSLSLAGFGAACLGALLVFWRFTRTAIATRRS